MNDVTVKQKNLKIQSLSWSLLLKSKNIRNTEIFIFKPWMQVHNEIVISGIDIVVKC